MLQTDNRKDCWPKTFVENSLYAPCHVDEIYPGMVYYRLYAGMYCKRQHCSIGTYKCYSNEYCISSMLICNGIKDCLMGDDELDCGKIIIKKNKKKLF